jgi:hypothetical protein
MQKNMLMHRFGDSRAMRSKHLEKFKRRPDISGGPKFVLHTASGLSVCANCGVLTTFIKKLIARLLAAGASERGFSWGKKTRKSKSKGNKMFFY